MPIGMFVLYLNLRSTQVGHLVVSLMMTVASWHCALLDHRHRHNLDRPDFNKKEFLNNF